MGNCMYVLLTHSCPNYFLYIDGIIWVPAILREWSPIFPNIYPSRGISVP